MWTQEQKKAFALEHLRGYYHNPETCAYDGERCKYWLESGKKCMFGKFLLNPEEFEMTTSSASGLIQDYTEAAILVPELIGVFTPEEWNVMQQIHDTIAKLKENSSFTKLKFFVENLGWFTMDELTAA